MNIKFSVTIFTLLVASAILILTGCNRKRTEKAYHENGNLMYEISYKGSVKHGPAIYYFQDGRKEVEYVYADDALNGMMTRWYFNGNIEFEEQYKENQLNGLSRHFLITGIISEEKNYKKGELHGAYKVFWEDGGLKIAGEYYEGFYHGRWEYFDHQGMKVGEAEFNKGSGTMIAFYKNGRKKQEVNYRENLKHGAEITWSEEGTKRFEHHYLMGELVNEITYTSKPDTKPE